MVELKYLPKCFGEYESDVCKTDGGECVDLETRNACAQKYSSGKYFPRSNFRGVTPDGEFFWEIKKWLRESE